MRELVPQVGENPLPCLRAARYVRIIAGTEEGTLRCDPPFPHPIMSAAAPTLAELAA